MAEKIIKEKKVKVKKEKPVKVKKVKVSKKVGVKIQPRVVEYKKPHVSKRQQGYMDKKSQLAVAGRQTKWAPVWVVLKKYGAGKRIHPSAVTARKRNWRRTKLDIRPRKMRKWHFG